MRRLIALTTALLLVLSIAGSAMADEIEYYGDCGKFDSGIMGVEGASLTLGDVTIVLYDWIAKDGEADEYVGFSYTVSGGTLDSVALKAGRDTFDLDPSAGSWLNPNGTAGRNAKAISNIAVCGADGDGGGPIG